MPSCCNLFHWAGSKGQKDILVGLASLLEYFLLHFIITRTVVNFFDILSMDWMINPSYYLGTQILNLRSYVRLLHYIQMDTTEIIWVKDMAF